MQLAVSATWRMIGNIRDFAKSLPEGKSSRRR
jgi:hypothetical protein